MFDRASTSARSTGFAPAAVARAVMMTLITIATSEAGRTRAG